MDGCGPGWGCRAGVTVRPVCGPRRSRGGSPGACGAWRCPRSQAARCQGPHMRALGTPRGFGVGGSRASRVCCIANLCVLIHSQVTSVSHFTLTERMFLWKYLLSKTKTFVGVSSYLSTDLCHVLFDRLQLDFYACWRVSQVQGVLLVEACKGWWPQACPWWPCQMIMAVPLTGHRTHRR